MWLINSLFSKTKNNECQDTNQHSTNEDEVNENKVKKDKVNEDKVNECKVNEDKVDECKVKENKVNECKVNEDKVNVCKVNEDKVNECKVNEESIKIEEKPIIKAEFKKRVEQVKLINKSLQAFQNKQDSNVNIDPTITKKKEEINSCKIDAVLRIIPVIETNLQTLTEKVSCLSGLINTKQLNSQTVTETVTDQNIVLNNENLNSVNKLNGMENTTTPRNKVKPQGKVPKKKQKTTKNKLSVTKKKKKKVELEANPAKIINQNDQAKNSENVAEDSAKSVDQLTNYLDGRLECFFTKIQSALSQFKTDQISEKCEIMVHLSGLDDKMNTNEMNIDKLVSNIQQLRKKNELAIMKKQSNAKIEDKLELQKSIDDIKMCIDYLVHPNSIEPQQTQQCTNTPNKNTNIKSTCTSDRCVCQLIDNTNTNAYTNAANIQIIKSNDGNDQIKYGDIILCEFLKAKLNMLKRSEDQYKVQVNQLSNKTGCKNTSHSSVCPKKPNHNVNVCCGKQINDKKTSHLPGCSKNLDQFSNNCVGNQIDNNTTNNLLECAKKLSNLKNNCAQKPNEEQKINHLAIRPKPSIHNFSINIVENDTKSNQPKKSVCGKNQICEFLASQPIPEWIRRSQTPVASVNPCRNPPTNCQLNAGKSYNIERIVKDSCDKRGSGSVAYEITQKQDVPEKNKKNGGAFKEHDLVPCNSLDSLTDSPWHVKR